LILVHIPLVAARIFSEERILGRFLGNKILDYQKRVRILLSPFLHQKWMRGGKFGTDPNTYNFGIFSPSSQAPLWALWFTCEATTTTAKSVFLT
jgi:hypothetical protein